MLFTVSQLSVWAYY